MAEAKFDKDGKIENLDELTVQEVADAYLKKNQEVFGRATTAEAQAKQEKEAREKAEKDLEEARKTPPKPEPEHKPDPARTLTDEEIQLMVAGLSKEEIAEAKAISIGKGIPLADALKDKTFLLFQQNFKEERQAEADKLGVSHGSNPGGSSSGKSKIKPGMTPEEHKAAFEEERHRLS